MTVLKKNGTALTTKLNVADMEKVQNEGIWFAEWNKDFNTYLIQNISSTKLNKKSKPLKQSLHTFILGKSPNTPVKHLNGDTLDNTRSNLEIVELNERNEIEQVDSDTIAILLKDKYGNVNAKALISSKDVKTVINDKYTWVQYKTHNNNSVVANTPEGRIYLDRIIMNPDETQTVHHINLNPLDNRRKNLELSGN